MNTMGMEDSYTRRYKMRLMGTDNATTTTTIPPLVVQREARKRGLTVAEFVQRFRVEAAFDNFEGVHYTFVEAEKAPKQEPNSVREKAEVNFDELRRKIRGGR